MAMILGDRLATGTVSSGVRCVPAALAISRAAGRMLALPSGVACGLRTSLRRRCIVRVATEEQETNSNQVTSSNEVTSSSSASKPQEREGWIPVCRPEDLPKGVRKEVEVDGRQVLLFWYRNQVYCIQARSPAEGAYSEGFITAKFTQDYCIECPSTSSLFSLKDGSIQSWYPNNAVLRALTPANLCKPLQLFPVKFAQEAIYVNVSGLGNASATARDRGGADTSIENNNVFSVQPTVYFEGMDPTKESASLLQDAPTGLNAAVAIPAVTLLGILAVLGTGICIYLEDLVLLAGFWAVLGGGTAFYTYRYLSSRSKQP